MKQQTLTMQDALNTAKMLSEALPYLQRYADAVVVVKFGGNAMGDDAAMAEFARDIVLMRQVGVNPVVVHGGGPMINEMLDKLGIKSQFVRGKRVTDKATVEVVEMILSGLVNKRIVQAIMDAGGRAVGISGKDDDLMVCEADDPELGFVGRPVEMNVQVLRDLYNAGIIPVVAPVATGMADNETFNVNGDTAAGAIAGALQADRLLLLTDVAGVKNADGQVISTGCSNCHAGSGLKPSREMSRAQLENSDCLICHSQGYRRTLVQSGEGRWEWKPLLWKNPEGLDSVARRISQPTRAMCLRCHAASGGGPNWKRGDLEYRLADTDRGFDVHMGKDGENMQCVKCHVGKDHRVAGRGADLPASDRTDAQLRCDGECHGTKPHKLAALDLHAQRVDCNVCHLPTFAREEATDMRRDWSRIVEAMRLVLETR